MLDIERDIMVEIGLGHDYNWSNGSPSCGGIRRAAVRQLPEVIARLHANYPDEIAAPDPTLMRMLKTVADREGYEHNPPLDIILRESRLTKTWQATAEVIRSHMERVHDRSALRKCEEYIRERFIKPAAPRHRAPSAYYGNRKGYDKDGFTYDEPYVIWE